MPKSTLADANETRDYRIYEGFSKTLMQRACREYVQTQLAVDVDNAVYASDASVIDLTLSLYPLAKFLKTKGTIKLHTIPVQGCDKEKQTNEIKIAIECEYQGFTFPGKRIVWTNKSLSWYTMNRPVRTRMRGGVGAGG